MDHCNCPVTHERFIHPVILPLCGHTLDKSVINKLSNCKCPICAADFIPDFTPTNWMLVTVLELDIPKTNEKLLLSANKAYQLSQIVINQKAFEIIVKINEEISKAALNGKLSTSIAISKEHSSLIINKVIELLHKESYNIQMLQQDNINSNIKLNISWFKLK